VVAVGDRPYYRGPGYWASGAYYVWRPVTGYGEMAASVDSWPLRRARILSWAWVAQQQSGEPRASERRRMCSTP